MPTYKFEFTDRIRNYDLRNTGDFETPEPIVRIEVHTRDRKVFAIGRAEGFLQQFSFYITDGCMAKMIQESFEEQAMKKGAIDA